MNIIPTTKRAAFNMTGVMSCFIHPQNGVPEGAMRYGSGDSSPQIAMGSEKDSHSNGNVVDSSNDMPKRPKMLLGVNSTNGYATAKALRDDSQDIGNGSLPCTPEADVDDLASGSLMGDTSRLISGFLEEFTGLKKSQWNESSELTTMKRVVEDILEKHRYAFNGMVNKLSLDNRSDDASFVGAVAESLFADGTTNWGRVASLVAFGAVVCQYLKEKGRGSCVELVGQEISTYLLTDQKDWMIKNNGWDGFVEFFRVADPESTVRNALMAVAGFAGIGAAMALMISRCAVV